MNTLVTDQVTRFIAVIQQDGVPALRVAFSIAVLVFLYGGVLIFRRRREFFARDPNVENDVPVVRHNREEETLFVWSGLMLVLIAILYQVCAHDMNNFKSQTQTQNPQEI